MTSFKQYSIDNAPAKSKGLLQAIAQKYGFLPNIFAHMAESPLPVKLYGVAQDLVAAEATLSAEEINLVQLATSVENECSFCVPAHSTVGKNKIKTDAAIIDAIREGRDGPNKRYNALVNFTQEVTRERGHVGKATIDSFLAAGYTREQIFEVVTIVAYKVLTNYTSALAGTQPNEQFAAEAWQPAKGKKAA